jgi:FixJ family two-component response regulator
LSDEHTPEGEAGERSYALIVSDSETNQLALEDILSTAGFEVASAPAERLLGMHDLVPPRLVILDDAQDLAGRKELQKALMRHPPLVGVPLILMSRDSDIDSFSAAIADGAAAYLKKPVEPGDLVDLAKRLVDWTGGGEWTEKRRRVRRPLILKVQMQYRSSGRRIAGQIIDASSGGCRVEVPEAVPAGEKVQVVLQDQEGGDTFLALGAEVRWHDPRGEGTHEIGLRFTGTTALLAGKILGFTPMDAT